jgi:hypothetical protein
MVLGMGGRKLVVQVQMVLIAVQKVQADDV